MLVEPMAALFNTSEFAVPVIFGGVTAAGILDQPDSTFVGENEIGIVEGSKPVLAIPSNTFAPMPLAGQAITVNGNAYRVGVPRKVDDGAITEYDLIGVS